MKEKKHSGGRPSLFKSAEDLKDAIDAYFLDKDQIHTITGLALHLGFSDRQSLYDYQERPEFSCIIKKARLRIENVYEQRLLSNSPTGSIFALKNMGWKDKVETEHSGSMGVIWQETKQYDSDEKTNKGA